MKQKKDLILIRKREKIICVRLYSNLCPQNNVGQRRKVDGQKIALNNQQTLKKKV
jgi:hypothetical protein